VEAIQLKGRQARRYRQTEGGQAGSGALRRAACGKRAAVGGREVARTGSVGMVERSRQLNMGKPR